MFLELWIWLCIIVVLFAALAIGWYAWWFKRRRFLKKRSELNGQARITAQQKGLNIDKVFVVNDHLTFDKTDEAIKPQFFIDTASRKMVFIDYDKPLTIVADFSEFLNYEIYENGSMAFCGGGAGGLLAGGFWGETVGKCNNLRLIVRLKRYECPQMTYDIIAKTPLNLGVVKTSRAYQKCVSSMQELASFFEVIKHESEERENKE